LHFLAILGATSAFFDQQNLTSLATPIPAKDAMKLCDFCDAEVIEGGKQEGGEDHTILGHRSAATDDDDDEDEDDW